MTSIVWFRKALRLHDNPALLEGVAGASRVAFVFVLDPWFCRPASVGKNRLSFLLQSLTELDRLLQACHGARLLVLRGKPEEVLPRAFKDWKSTRLAFEADAEPYARRRDAAVRALAQSAGVEVCSPSGHTLYPPELLLASNGGALPKVN